MPSFDLTTPGVTEEVISLGTLIVDLVGVFAGAVLGALQAERRKMDLMGFLVLGLVSGVGGGIIRDTLLQAGPLLALGAFAVAGTQRTLEVGLHPGTALLMGVITAAGGGVVRDVLTRQTPTRMQRKVRLIRGGAVDSGGSACCHASWMCCCITRSEPLPGRRHRGHEPLRPNEERLEVGEPEEVEAQSRKVEEHNHPRRERECLFSHPRDPPVFAEHPAR